MNIFELFRQCNNEVLSKPFQKINQLLPTFYIDYYSNDGLIISFSSNAQGERFFHYLYTPWGCISLVTSAFKREEYNAIFEKFMKRFTLRKFRSATARQWGLIKITHFNGIELPPAVYSLEDRLPYPYYPPEEKTTIDKIVFKDFIPLYKAAPSCACCFNKEFRFKTQLFKHYALSDSNEYIMDIDNYELFNSVMRIKETIMRYIDDINDQDVIAHYTSVQPDPTDAYNENGLIFEVAQINDEVFLLLLTPWGSVRLARAQNRKEIHNALKLLIPVGGTLEPLDILPVEYGETDAEAVDHALQSWHKHAQRYCNQV